MDAKFVTRINMNLIVSVLNTDQKLPHSLISLFVY